MAKLYLWWLRTFNVISTQKAISLGLKFKGNIYGDRINHLNCRSIWSDKNGNEYRVEELHV